MGTGKTIVLYNDYKEVMPFTCCESECCVVGWRSLLLGSKERTTSLLGLLSFGIKVNCLDHDPRDPRLAAGDWVDLALSAMREGARSATWQLHNVRDRIQYH